jgi:hypothetical protein
VGICFAGAILVNQGGTNSPARRPDHEKARGRGSSPLSDVSPPSDLPRAAYPRGVAICQALWPAAHSRAFVAAAWIMRGEAVMPRKALRLPNFNVEFTGELARPVASNVIFPEDQKDWAEYSNQRSQQLLEARLKKMPLLAKALRLNFDHLDLKLDAHRVTFYSSIAMQLAILVCPGFQEKRRSKTPPEFVRWLLMRIEKGKTDGQYKSDLDGCLDWLKQTQPELALSRNKTHLNARARTLRNLIAAARAELKRAKGK